MSQVSKYPVTTAVEKRMSDILIETVSRLHSGSEIQDFLSEFLSPVEKIMLTKRMAIAVLLAKGYDYESIKKILRVTPTTIAAVNRSLKFSQKGYKSAVEKIIASEMLDDFWRHIDDILHNAIPPRSGNWSYMRSRREANKRKHMKPF